MSALMAVFQTKNSFPITAPQQYHGLLPHISTSRHGILPEMGYCGLSSASIARKATVGTPSSPSYQAAENGRVVKGTTASVVAQVFWDNKEYRPCAIAHNWCRKCFEFFKQVRS